MNTISARPIEIASFNNTQSLALLTNKFVAGHGEIAAYPPITAWLGLHPDRRKTAAVTRDKAELAENPGSGVLLRVERETVGERIAFMMLGLSALAGLAQAFGTMAALASNWELFSAWVARLLS